VLTCGPILVLDQGPIAASKPAAVSYKYRVAPTPLLSVSSHCFARWLVWSKLARVSIVLAGDSSRWARSLSGRVPIPRNTIFRRTRLQLTFPDSSSLLLSGDQTSAFATRRASVPDPCAARDRRSGLRAVAK